MVERIIPICGKWLAHLRQMDDPEASDKMHDELIQLLDDHEYDLLMVQDHVIGHGRKIDPKNFPMDLFDAKVFVRCMVCFGGKYLKYASKGIKLDEEFMLDIIRIDYTTVKYIPDELLAERDFIRRAIEIRPFIYKHAKDNVKNDRSIVTMLLLKDTNMFKHIPVFLKRDREIRDLYIMRCSRAPRRLPIDINADELIRYGEFYKSNGLRDFGCRNIIDNVTSKFSKNTLTKMVTSNPNLAAFVPSELAHDFELLREVYKSSFDNLLHPISSLAEFAWDELKTFAPKEFTSDAIVRFAYHRQALDEWTIEDSIRVLDEDVWNYPHIPGEHKSDPRIKMKMFSSEKTYTWAKGAASEIDDKAMAILAVTTHPVYHKLPEKMKRDDDVIMAAISKNPSTIMHVPSDKQLDPYITLMCIMSRGTSRKDWEPLASTIKCYGKFVYNIMNDGTKAIDEHIEGIMLSLSLTQTDPDNPFYFLGVLLMVDMPDLLFNPLAGAYLDAL